MISYEKIQDFKLSTDFKVLCKQNWRSFFGTNFRVCIAENLDLDRHLKIQQHKNNIQQTTNGAIIVCDVYVNENQYTTSPFCIVFAQQPYQFC